MAYIKFFIIITVSWRWNSLIAFTALIMQYADADFVINSMTDCIIRDIRNSMIMLHGDKTKFFVLGNR